jgi:hypothetical protein
VAGGATRPPQKLFFMEMSTFTIAMIENTTRVLLVLFLITKFLFFVKDFFASLLPPDHEIDK